jgi:ADP-dependent NAD(P)H-hydrate dehydratase / NAD(P)H-hydrate epimerase
VKLFKSTQIHEIDAYTIANEPIKSGDLMERAASKLFKVFRSKFNQASDVVFFIGPGNNGGDGLALARMLYNSDFKVAVFLACKPDKLAGDAKLNFDRLQSIGLQPVILSEKDVLPVLDRKIVVDALFGSGLSRPLEGLYRNIVQHINNSKGIVFSIDIPSGLFGESNKNNDRSAVVIAHITVAFQFPRLSFLLAENEHFLGQVIIEDIGLHSEGIQRTPTPFWLLTREHVSRLLIPRKRFSHKGTYGHALLISGSYGKMGAAVLASRACLKSGVGLLTTQIPRKGYEIMQTAIPESMVNIDRSEILVSEFPDLSPFSAIGLGPGIGIKHNTALMTALLIEQSDKPMVIDADGINILAQNKELLNKLKPGTVLTPHPGEFQRLFGTFDCQFERLEFQMKMSVQHKLVIVLKGAFSTITTPDGMCYFNPTGNPGMASAGSGDVLTGIILSMLSQGYSSDVAAIISVWVHGRAADIYASENGMEALTATDIIDNLGKAFVECHTLLKKEINFDTKY